MDDNKFKDYILKLASEKVDLANSDISYDEFRVWRKYMNEIVDEGYIYDEGNVVGLLSPRFTDKELVFWMKGGYSKKVKDKRKERAVELIKEAAPLILEIAKTMFSA